MDCSKHFKLRKELLQTEASSARDRVAGAKGRPEGLAAGRAEEALAVVAAVAVGVRLPARLPVPAPRAPSLET